MSKATSETCVGNQNIFHTGNLCDPAALGGVYTEVGVDHHTHILLGEILQTSLSLRQEELAG